MANFKGSENTTLQILINNMKENFALGRWKEEEQKLGRTVEGMKVTLKTVKKMEKAPFTGQVDKPISEVGGQENNTALGYYTMQILQKKSMENG